MARWQQGQYPDDFCHPYLADLDRALPGRVAGCYLVGSTALGAFRLGRSDIDVVVVVDGDLDADALRRVRRVQWRSGVRTATAAVAGRRSPLTGAVNGVYVRADDLHRPVSEVHDLEGVLTRRLLRHHLAVIDAAQ